jgi:hypothetical protein
MYFNMRNGYSYAIFRHACEQSVCIQFEISASVVKGTNEKINIKFMLPQKF